MCGFAGVVAPPSPEVGRAWSRWAADRMVRRGPDDEGHWEAPDEGVHLSFRRLAIIDLSEHGHQPMVGRGGDSVLVFNGELYGHRDLRRELAGRGATFRGTSDTEVVLAALDEWGEAALERFDGMFALAWWQRSRRRLVLGRDHAGIKPLFYGTGPSGRGVCFASQYDVVARGPWGQPPIDPEALALHLELHHVPAPHGLLARTGQLEPGQVVVVEDGHITSRRRWWTLPPATAELRGTAAVDAIETTLRAAVEQQLVADRPVGTFLSGGVDSALVTGVAVDEVSEPLSSFTVSFPGGSADEADEAAAFATRFGVEHHVIRLDDDGASAAVDDAIGAMAEPVGDFSIVPTTLLTGFAADRVTVALSGDGGDELFHGYERPWSLLRDGRWFAAPHAVRRARYLAGRGVPGVPRVSEAIAATSPGAYYRGVNSRSTVGPPAARPGPARPSPAVVLRHARPPRPGRAGRPHPPGRVPRPAPARAPQGRPGVDAPQPRGPRARPQPADGRAQQHGRRRRLPAGRSPEGPAARPARPARARRRPADRQEGLHPAAQPVDRRAPPPDGCRTRSRRRTGTSTPTSTPPPCAPWPTPRPRGATGTCGPSWPSSGGSSASPTSPPPCRRSCDDDRTALARAAHHPQLRHRGLGQGPRQPGRAARPHPLHPRRRRAPPGRHAARGPPRGRRHRGRRARAQPLRPPLPDPALAGLAGRPRPPAAGHRPGALLRLRRLLHRGPGRPGGRCEVRLDQEEHGLGVAGLAPAVAALAPHRGAERGDVPPLLPRPAAPRPLPLRPSRGRGRPVRRSRRRRAVATSGPSWASPPTRSWWRRWPASSRGRTRCSSSMPSPTATTCTWS